MIKELKNAPFAPINVEYIPQTSASPATTIVGGVKCFSVAKTFDCGQCFRFEPVEGTGHESEFFGVAFGRAFSVARDGENIIIYGCDRRFFEDRIYGFLSLDVDYERINEDILSHCDGEYMKNALRLGSGIRILKQDMWEALCSFIISQNNNIPRIKRIISALSERCGDEIDAGALGAHGGGGVCYAFPSAERVLALGEEGLRELKVGFRAAYIVDAAKKVVSGELSLERLAEVDTERCISGLCGVHGVGMKVASCAALFGMRKYDAFPVDVWIKRVLAAHFDADFTPAALGDYAGIAQQYMFYAARFAEGES